MDKRERLKKQMDFIIEVDMIQNLGDRKILDHLNIK